MTDAGAETQLRPKKLRSPSYPSIDLGTAVKRAEAFYEKEKRNAAPLRIAAQHWGSNEKSSAALQAVAALKSFGLLSEAEGADRRVQLTELALRIILDKRDASAEREQAIKKSALLPKMHQTLWSKYGESLPSDENLAHELVFDWRFNENSVRDFIREYKTTILYAKLSSSDRLSEEVHDTGVPINELSVKESPSAAPVSPATVPPRPRTMAEAQQAAGQFDALPNNRRQDVFSLAEGPVTIQWPATLSPDSFQDLGDWIDILKRKISRSVVKPEKAEGA